MKHTQTFILFLAVFFLAAPAFAVYHFPTDKNCYYNVEYHFGDEWFKTTSQYATITAWFVNNWVNYTVSGAGIQTLYNSSKPDEIYINGVLGSEGVDWTYGTGGTGIIRVTTATTSVAISFGLIIPPVDNPPSLFDYDVSTTVEYLECTFEAWWSDDHGLSFGWLSTDIDGWHNHTKQNISGYYFSDTETLPIHGTTVQYIFYANDTAGQEAASSTYSFVTIELSLPETVPEIPPQSLEGQNPLIYGQNVTLDYPLTSSFGFQTVSAFKMTVTTGTFEAPFSNILVYQTSGVIYFVPTYTFSLTVKADLAEGRKLSFSVSGTDIAITQTSNTEWTITAYSSRHSSTIQWYYSEVSYVDMYTMMAVGLVGVGIMVFIPSWITWHVKDHGVDNETWEKLLYGMCFFFMGLGLFVVWIWP